MGSQPWKDAYVDRLLDAFSGQQVVVRGPNGGVLVKGSLTGDGYTASGVRCLIVNDAPAELVARWRDAPDATARGEIDLFAHDQWIPLERGLDVNGLVAGNA
jgi:hypothetical protein